MTIRHALVPAYLAACLLLGGASAAGYAANMVLQLAALPIICLALWTLFFDPPANLSRTPLIFFGICLVFMTLQLVPLPPAFWTALPGRGTVVEGFRLLQVPLPWLPLSLDPTGTLASLLWLLPAIGTLLGVVVLGGFRGSLLSWSLLVVTVLSIAIGALQLVGGKVGGAYIYDITNYGVAVGFFANGNHMATLLLVAIPFLGALQLSLLRRARSPRNASAVRVLTATIFIVLIVGLLTNLSLAGLGLSVPVVLVTFLSFRRKEVRPKWWMVGVALALSIAAVATIVLGPFGNNLVGEQQHNAELSRRTSFQLTLNAARGYLPVGSGVGTFQEVYRTQETLRNVTTVYMNHAHSDWLEVLLETGLLGIGLAASFLLWWIMRVRAIWTATGPDYYARAAAIATGTILLHSLVDYPLRTAAISAIFAMCAGLMSDARPFARRQTASASTRHVTI